MKSFARLVDSLPLQQHNDRGGALLDVLRKRACNNVKSRLVYNTRAVVVTNEEKAAENIEAALQLYNTIFLLKMQILI